MPAIEKKMRVYDNWTGGNWGAEGPVNAAVTNPFKYRAVNLQVYANGSLGPRPGWCPTSLTGTPPSSASGADFYGFIWLPRPSTESGMALYVSALGSSVRLDLDSMAWQTSVLGTATGLEGVVESNAGNFTFINPQTVIVGATKYYNPHTNAATTTITYPSSFAPTHTSFYKDRLYAWGDATYQNRVYYSDFGTFATFTAGNYFDIGVGSATSTTRPRIRGSWVIKDTLMFLVTPGDITNNDAYGEIWVLQGANAITGTLSRVDKGKVPLYASLSTVHHEVLIGMDFSFGRGAVMLSPQGIESEALSFLRPGNEQYQEGWGRSPASSYGEDSLILPYIGAAFTEPDTADPTADADNPVGDYAEIGLQAWELVHGVWTKSLWFNGAVAETVDTSPIINFVHAVVPFQGNKLLMLTNAESDLSGTWRVHHRDICLDRPGRSTDTWSRGSEHHIDLTGTPFDLNCQLWLPEEMADIGCGVHVSRVVVEFDYWKHADFQPASQADFSVKVRYSGLDVGPDKETDTQGGEDGSFDYLVATEGTMPKRGRRVFKFGEEAYYGSFQVVFPSVQNVSFRKVTVFYNQKITEVM